MFFLFLLICIWLLRLLSLIKLLSFGVCRFQILSEISWSMISSITCLLHDKSFSFAGVYGANTYLVRQLLWRDFSFFTRTCCILGDFNVVLSANDCKGGVAPNKVSCIEFRDWINTNDLTCMPFTGPCCTWCNGWRGLHRIHRKLDRALCNGVCLNEWDSCTYQVLIKSCSNHSPILASLASNFLRKVSNFCFFSVASG